MSGIGPKSLGPVGEMSLAPKKNVFLMFGPVRAMELK